MFFAVLVAVVVVVTYGSLLISLNDMTSISSLFIWGTLGLNKIKEAP